MDLRSVESMESSSRIIGGGFFAERAVRSARHGESE